jgi:putative photosynthetic complex assembly protein
MRGLARERRQHSIGAAPPFRLTLWRNGMLSLVDTATGRTVELDGFGPTNRAAFARFLKGAA